MVQLVVGVIVGLELGLDSIGVRVGNLELLSWGLCWD